MKKFIGEFKKIEKIVREEDTERKGIAEEDGEYILVEKDDERAIMTVEVAYVDGEYLVDFNEPSKWYNSNIVLGIFENI
ncbi:MAG: hypothetical protein Q4D02_01695 [Clostridia bacterium]|nr:hypothetical protein [Clostridia bacterium]